MWSIAGGIGIISILVSPMGQRILKGLQTQQNSVILESQRVVDLGSSRHKIHKFSIKQDYKSFQKRVEDYTILDALTVGIPVSIRIKQGFLYPIKNDYNYKCHNCGVSKFLVISSGSGHHSA